MLLFCVCRRLGLLLDCSEEDVVMVVIVQPARTCIQTIAIFGLNRFESTFS